MKITLKKPPIEVPYPPDPGFVVSVRRLNPVESWGIQQKIRQATIKEPEVHPITGDPIFGRNGDVIHRREALPPEEILAILREIVVGWTPVDSEEGPIKPELDKEGKPKNAAFLLGEEFTYQTETEISLPVLDPNTGKPELDESGKGKTYLKKLPIWTTFWSELFEIAKGNRKTAAVVAANSEEQEEGKASPTQ